MQIIPIVTGVPVGVAPADEGLEGPDEGALEEALVAPLLLDEQAPNTRTIAMAPTTGHKFRFRFSLTLVPPYGEQAFYSLA